MCLIRTVLGHAVPWLATPLLALCLTSLFPPSADAQTFAVRQVRVFDGERLHTGMTVVARDGTIRSVQADTIVPPGIEVIDGTGRTLLPGLFDSHTHTRGNGLTQALAFGVTTVIDMFTDHSWAAERREEQRRGAATGRSDLVSAGLLVTAPGGHGTQYGIEIPTITAPGKARETVETRLAQGSDFIKIIYQPCDGCKSVDSATMHAVIAETHRRGRKAVVHIHTLEYGRTAIRAGADAIAHLFADRVADAAFLTLIRERGAFVVPTLTVIAALGGERGAEALAAHPQIGPYLSGADVKRLIAYNPQGRTNRWFQFDSAATSLRMLAERGVPILAGSDPPNIGTAWGASIHRELELMVRAGLSPTATLQAATSVPARIFGLDDRGRIAPGLRADLLLIDGDPTADILATRNIVAIWKQGVRFDRRAYRTALPAEGNP
jgi:imidazolonepropionase-like amidohydrolase